MKKVIAILVTGTAVIIILLTIQFKVGEVERQQRLESLNQLKSIVLATQKIVDAIHEYEKSNGHCPQSIQDVVSVYLSKAEYKKWTENIRDGKYVVKYICDENHRLKCRNWSMEINAKKEYRKVKYGCFEKENAWRYYLNREDHGYLDY